MGAEKNKAITRLTCPDLLATTFPRGREREDRHDRKGAL